ncbi:tetratricopeptide repeat protein, partial [bacterium]|nr:tetratricopeptide repeat protein [bacterium]
MRKMLRQSLEWLLPWIIGVGLIWFVVTPGDAAESVPAEDAAAAVTSGEANGDAPASLYDLANLPRKLRKVVFRAATYGKRREPQKAVDLLTGHLRDHPDQDHYLLRLHLAQNLADLDETALAREHYRRSVQLEPDLDRGWLGLADTSYDLEDFELAGDAFVQGYRTSPEHPSQVLYFAGAAYLMGNETERAVDVFTELTSGDAGFPQLPWYRGLVIAAARLGRPERADAAVARMVDTFAEEPDAWYLKYQHEAGKKNYREAAVSLRFVGFLRELTPAETQQLGDLYVVLGVPWLASRQYAAALGDSARAEEWERLGSALVAAHETDAALDVLNEALAAEESPRLWALLGDIHYLRQEYAQAREAFARIADRDESGRALLMEGYC